MTNLYFIGLFIYLRSKLANSSLQTLTAAIWQYWVTLPCSNVYILSLGRLENGVYCKNVILQDIRRDLLLEGENGNCMPALRVFSESIKFLRNHLEEHLRNKPDGMIRADEVDWVLTVPAIWSDPAKKFMREAANMVRLKLHLVTTFHTDFYFSSFLRIIFSANQST